MSDTPVKLMLLGIGLILFGLVFPTTFLPLLELWLAPERRPVGVTEALLRSLFPVAGLVLVFIGFFTGRRPSA